MDEIKAIYAVIQRKVEKYPYAEENDEYMPGFLRVYTESTEIEYDPKRDLLVATWEGLIKDVYAQKNLSLPFPLLPLDELIGTEQPTPDGEMVLIEGSDSYLYRYGLEPANLYWIREIPVFAALCMTEEDAKRFIERYQDELSVPQIRPFPLNTLLDP